MGGEGLKKTYVSTLDRAAEIADRLEAGQSYEMTSVRRSGKSTLVMLVSAELRRRKISHKIIVTCNDDVASYARAACTENVVKVGSSVVGARAVIVDEPEVMKPELLAGLGSVPTFRIGTSIG